MPRFITPLKAALLATVMTSTGAALAADDYSLTLENCGQTLQFDSVPAKVVTVGQAGTEIMYRLGLESHVTATSNWFSDVAPQFKELNAGVERLSDNFPSFESVVAKRPALVTADFFYGIGPQGVVGKREQFHNLGINTYVLASQCMDQDSSKGSDGVRTAMFKIENLYQNVRDYAAIFNVNVKGQALIDELKKREASAVERAAQLKVKNQSAVVWYSSADMEMDPWVAGTSGVPVWILHSLGLRNVIESQEVWPSVGWESIAKADPDVIVVAEMSRRRFEADDVKAKIEFLRTDPVAREMKAVKNNRIVVMDAHAMDVTLRAIEGLETLLEALEHNE